LSITGATLHWNAGWIELYSARPGMRHFPGSWIMF
jgi:hypothetical protein